MQKCILTKAFIDIIWHFSILFHCGKKMCDAFSNYYKLYFILSLFYTSLKSLIFPTYINHRKRLLFFLRRQAEMLDITILRALLRYPKSMLPLLLDFITGFIFIYYPHLIKRRNYKVILKINKNAFIILKNRFYKL